MSNRLNLLWLAVLLMLIALTAWKQRAPVTPGLEDVAWKSIELHNALPPGELVSRITDEAVIRTFVMKLVEQKLLKDRHNLAQCRIT